MVKITKKNGSFSLVFAPEEAMAAGLQPEKEYELSKARDGIWVMVEGAAQAVQKPPAAFDGAEQKILELLKKLPNRDLMEGWFEKKLSEAEKAKFKEMLEKGAVIKFKSSEHFRKALYIIPKKSRADPGQKFDNTEKPIEEFSLEKDGFLVVKNEMRAKALSDELRERIKAGEIKGTRAFSGEFFIINNALLESAQFKVLSEIKQLKAAPLLQLSQKTGLTPTVVRIANEFLKEEGQVIEKKKDLYQYIG
ncbi:MAG TPA: hypothetical protein HA254_02605 [Candidatus Diapherotrites archaeon]|uniref:Uncharacterized protein n=1 Tax=Candidatus Iainarchaeum sp. TaxID=3101447 RepID=A0A7J4IZ45_9ARCH|nr:hypothetical protein [Candidatus Diapherotrites archaeon]